MVKGARPPRSGRDGTPKILNFQRARVKIGTKLVSHGRYVTFQMAEVAVPRPIAENRVADRWFATKAQVRRELGGQGQGEILGSSVSG